jgi:amino acid transporter
VLTCTFTILLSLLNIGSTVAFSAIVSLQLSSLMLTYMLSISCVFYRRLTHPELLPPARWSLGRFGVMINGAALIFSTYLFFWCFWPLQTPVDLTTFNWAVLMFFTIVIVSTTFYFLGGRRKYAGPVSLVIRV